MKFEELQGQWDSIKFEPKSDDELRRMMYSSPAWRLRGLTRAELWWLTWNGAVAIGLIVVCDPFRSSFAAWTFILSLLCGVVQGLDRYLGLYFLRNLPIKGSLRESLTDSLAYIKRRAVISQVVSALVWIALVLIIGTRVSIGQLSLLSWAIVLLPFLAFLLWQNFKTWSEQKADVMSWLKDLGDDDLL